MFEAHKHIIDILGDCSLSSRERRAAFDQLDSVGPGLIESIRAAGVLPIPAWPSRETARNIAGHDLFLLAVCMPDELIAKALRTISDDMDELVLAIRLSAAIAPHDRQAAERFEPLVRSLLSDTRPAFPHMQFSADSVGGYAQEFHRILIRSVAPGDPRRHAQLIEDAIRASLPRGSQESHLYNIFHDGLLIGMSPNRLTSVLVNALQDSRNPPSARISARRSLDVLAGLAQHPDGAPEDMQIAVERARSEAGEQLASILRDTQSPEELCRSIRANLHRWAPQVHVQLQKENVMPVESVPSRRTHKNWTPTGIEELAARVSFDEVLALLGKPCETEIDRIVTSLRIAPSLAAWLPGATLLLAPLFQALFTSRLPVPMKSGVRSLGDMALEQFPGLFPPSDSQTEEMRKLLIEGLQSARAADLDVERIRDWLPGLLPPAVRKKLKW